ncbi:MAG: acetate/propionate family kinase [Flavobacteriales bacterium]|nr:acetate/propionate family kinase [Flavobacteriales bacterium]
MNILVINAGSSSIKTAVLSTLTGEKVFSLSAKNVLSNPEISHSNSEENIMLSKKGQEHAMKTAFEIILEQTKELNIEGVGHRVVHGGDLYSEPTLIDSKVITTINELSSLAPLHNPNNLKGIELAMEFFTDLPHIAVFDTAFHGTLPKRAKYYAIPKNLSDKHGVKRYGFHGTSHKYVAEKAARYLNSDIQNLKLITCHLGNGCSITAVEYGRSVETSMGLTPLEGLVMGTRSGDIDAGSLIHLAKAEGLSIDELDKMLNKESGLKGLSGLTNDMKTIEEKAAEGDVNCRLAIQVFAHRLRKYIGAYATIMGGVDAIIFTGGIGENSAAIRHRVCQRLDFLGAVINEDSNRDVSLSKDNNVVDFSERNSRVKLLAVATNEELEIAMQSSKIIEEKFKVNEQLTIPIAVSARHVHLTQESIDILFGNGYQLTEYKPLSQPGQFAANEKVTLVGPKNQIERVRILGPTRSKNQVEISRTDEFFLGIDAPVRASGHVEDSPGIKLIGPKGELNLKEGVICAWRHIHMTPEDAKNFGVQDKDVVEVRVQNEERTLTFGNVLIRVSPKYKLEMHIDTDEGNAAELGKGAVGMLVDTQSEACLIKRSTAFDEV